MSTGHVFKNYLAWDQEKGTYFPARIDQTQNASQLNAQFWTNQNGKQRKIHAFHQDSSQRIVKML